MTLPKRIILGGPILSSKAVKLVMDSEYLDFRKVIDSANADKTKEKQ